VLLELKAVRKLHRRGSEVVAALDGVDLCLDHGEFVAVVGPSGSGKSTLLNVAGGLDTPDEGSVMLDGHDLAVMSFDERARLRRREVGFVFQLFHLLPGLSVAQNVELPLLLERRRDRRGAVIDALDRVGLAALASRYPSELSGGQMQRVAIARALVHQPRLVLADEPTGNLDSATGAAVLDALTARVRDSGSSLLLVTHDVGAVAKADRVVRLRDGRSVGATDGRVTR
jgi:putative ABC transport system ATP-binding protein